MMRRLSLIFMLVLSMAGSGYVFAQTKTPAQVQSDANRFACEEMATRIPVSDPVKVVQEQAAFVDTCLQERNMLFYRQIKDRCGRSVSAMKTDDSVTKLYKQCMGSYGLE